MNHRISAGAIIEKGNRFLLVNHRLADMKFWFAADVVSGRLDVSAPEAPSEHIVAAAWLGAGELKGEEVFPPVLLGDYVMHKQEGVQGLRRLPLREMRFW